MIFIFNYLWYNKNSFKYSKSHKTCKNASTVDGDRLS